MLEIVLLPWTLPVNARTRVCPHLPQKTSSSFDIRSCWQKNPGEEGLFGLNSCLLQSCPLSAAWFIHDPDAPRFPATASQSESILCGLPSGHPDSGHNWHQRLRKLSMNSNHANPKCTGRSSNTTSQTKGSLSTTSLVLGHPGVVPEQKPWPVSRDPPSRLSSLPQA